MPEPQHHAQSSSATNLRIEPVRWGDIGAIVTIQNASFRPGLAYGRIALTLLKLMPGVRFFVARTDALPVAGMVIGDVHRGNARVMNIAVAPDARRQGIGTALLHSIETAIPGGNVTLMAEQHNTGAQSLYEREGYERSGFANHYYGTNRHGVWMKKQRVPLPDTTVRV